MVKIKEKESSIIKEGVVELQNKIASWELKVSQDLLKIFEIFSQVDSESIKQETEMLKKYHPEEYKEYIAILTQMKQKEKPVQSVEEQKKLLMEDALILWKTESYPRKNFNKDPLGEKYEKENKAARKEFEEIFDKVYKDKKITFWNKEAVYGWLSFRANYNTYDLMFLYHEQPRDVGYPLRVIQDGDKIRIESNSLSVSMDTIDDTSKNLLKEMFIYHSNNQTFKEYHQKSSETIWV